MKKKYKISKGKYYFNIGSGISSILIHRNSKSEAVHTYLSYKKNGKQCEWLGKWNGSKFDDAKEPSS